MKTLKLTLFIFILVIIGAGVYFFSVNKNQPINGNAAIVSTAPPGEVPVANMPNPASVYCSKNGGTSAIRSASDGSQSGVCVFADGKECDEWLFFKGECTAPIPIAGTEKAVQAFLANKYKRPISEVNVTVQKEAPGFAAGSVSFGQGGTGEGGMWLAVAGNQWDVVWDGNGSIDCNKMRQQYGFPDSILKPNFCD